MSRNSGTGQSNRYATFEPRPSRHATTGGRVTSFAYEEGWSSTVAVLRCLEMKEMQRVGVQCFGNRFPSSLPRVSPLDRCSLCVSRQGLYQEAHIPPVTDTVHATKQRYRGSPRHYISRVLQSPLPCPKQVRRLETSHQPLNFLSSFLEIPHFTMESAESIWRSLPSILWMPISTYPSTEVIENVFDFRLGTPYTNSGHYRLAFL